MTIDALITGHTCSEACWTAREDVCRCSCGGKNHGILLNGGQRPDRTCRIQGKRYRLASMGDFMQVCHERHSINEASWKASYIHAAIDKPATESQWKWPEVSAWMDAHPRVATCGSVSRDVPYLLWVLDSYQERLAA